MRKTELENLEHYHVYNRGVDKRLVFQDQEDVERFLVSMKLFNSVEPIGSIYEISRGGRTATGSKSREKVKTKPKPLVDIVCYCLNPNHYHLVLKQLCDGGISEFMKRLGGGYTWYFNNKYGRSGSLFEGKFKAVHIESNAQLLHLSVYVNLNDRRHQFGGPTAKLVRSSWDEYIGSEREGICKRDIILGQFGKRSEYKKFALETIEDIQNRKKKEKEPKELFLEEL